MRNTSDTLEIMVIFNNESLKHNETIPHLKSFCSVDDKTKSLSYLNNAARYNGTNKYLVILRIKLRLSIAPELRNLM